MMNYSELKSLDLETLESTILHELYKGIEHCENDYAEPDSSCIYLADIYLNRLKQSYGANLSSMLIEVNQEILESRKDINSPFLSDPESGITYADFLFTHVNFEVARKCINEMITTDCDNINHPLLSLLSNGEFYAANNVADFCTNLPSLKNLQRTFVIGMSVLAQKGETNNSFANEDSSAKSVLSKTGMPVDFKFKGKKLYELADKYKFGEVYSYVTSTLLSEKANAIFEQNKNEHDDAIVLTDVNRSL